VELERQQESNNPDLVNYVTCIADNYPTITDSAKCLSTWNVLPVTTEQSKEMDLVLHV